MLIYSYNNKEREKNMYKEEIKIIQKTRRLEVLNNLKMKYMESYMSDFNLYFLNTNIQIGLKIYQHEISDTLKINENINISINNLTDFKNIKKYLDNNNIVKIIFIEEIILKVLYEIYNLKLTIKDIKHKEIQADNYYNNNFNYKINLCNNLIKTDNYYSNNFDFFKGDENAF